MEGGDHSLPVMRSNSNPFPPDHVGPAPTYSIRATVVGTLFMAAVIMGVLFAVSNPVATALAGALALVASATVRRRCAVRRREGRAREVCVPKTGVCVEL